MRILGVSNDDTQANARFAADNAFSFPLLCDVGLEVSIAFGAARAGDAAAQRIAVLVDSEGRVEQYIEQVDAATFPRSLLNTL